MLELTKYDIERTLNRKKLRNQVPNKTKNEKVREIIKKNSPNVCLDINN